MNAEPICADVVPARRHSAGSSRVHDEFVAVCESLGQRLLDGTMPPDEAYWWTRIVASEVELRR
jgi:hypothetical protein